MHLESFYANSKNISGSELTFPDDEVRHLYKVLRKKKGDLVWVVDGLGTAYEVEIQYIGRNGAWGKILTTRRLMREPVTEITLAQGILKGERFDWLVEKTCEIGVRKIIPMTCETSVTSAGPQKLARWQRVAMAAMKQSGRCILPQITQPKTISQVLAMGTDCQYRFIAHTGLENKPLRIPDQKRPLVTPKIICVVGPEGGFIEEEIEEAIDQGFQPISLGSRRLRAETAGIVLLTLLLSQLGEIE